MTDFRYMIYQTDRQMKNMSYKLSQLVARREDKIVALQFNTLTRVEAIESTPRFHVLHLYGTESPLTFHVERKRTTEELKMLSISPDVKVFLSLNRH